MVAVGQPLAVAGDLVHLPCGCCPADVVAHDGPLPLALHDDAVTVHHGLEGGHGLMGFETGQRQVDGTVQAAVVVLSDEVAVLVNAVGNAFHRHVVEGVGQPLPALVLGHAGARALMAPLPLLALYKLDVQRVIAVIEGIQAAQTHGGLDAVAVPRHPCRDRVLDDTVARNRERIVLDNNLTVHLLTPVAGTQHQAHGYSHEPQG